MEIILTNEALEAAEKKRVFFRTDGTRRLHAGTPVYSTESFRIEPYSVLGDGRHLTSIGSFSYSFSELPFTSTVGRYCSISWSVRIMNQNQHPLNFVSTSSFAYDGNGVMFRTALEDFGATGFSRYHAPPTRPNRNDPPMIGHDVWIGHDAVLARGITLGHGCVVGAYAVVTKSVPPYAVVGGNPAKIIKMRFPEPMIERLLKSAWWQYKFTDFAQMRYDNPSLFLDQLEDRLASNTIAPYAPDPLTLADLVPGSSVTR